MSLQYSLPPEAADASVVVKIAGDDAIRIRATVIAVAAQPRPPPIPAIMFDMFVGSKNKDLRSLFLSPRE
jgi:hypothetical protein